MKAQRKAGMEKSVSHISSVDQIEHDVPPLLTDNIEPDRQTRHRLIEEAAYQRAAKRGFQNGSALDDWLAAEAEINAKHR